MLTAIFGNEYTGILAFIFAAFKWSAVVSRRSAVG